MENSLSERFGRIKYADWCTRSKKNARRVLVDDEVFDCISDASRFLGLEPARLRYRIDRYGEYKGHKIAFEKK